jgi:nigerose phosphorylase
MGGSHPAANGGAWMTAVFGFGGVQSTAKHVVINPRLYKKWNSLQFNMIYKGDRFNVKISQQKVELVADAANKNTNTFIVYGESLAVAPGTTIVQEGNKIGSPVL